jgi:hypothetical protein
VGQHAKGEKIQNPLEAASRGLQSTSTDLGTGTQNGKKAILPEGNSKPPATGPDQTGDPKTAPTQNGKANPSTASQKPVKETPIVNPSIPATQKGPSRSSTQPGNTERISKDQTRQDGSPSVLIPEVYSRFQRQRDSILIREILHAPEASALQELVELLDDADHIRLEVVEDFMIGNGSDREMAKQARCILEAHEWPIRNIDEFKSFLNRWRGWYASKTTRKSLSATPAKENPITRKLISPTSRDPSELGPSPPVNREPATHTIIEIIELDTQKEWQSWLNELAALKARLDKDSASLAPRQEDYNSKKSDVARMSHGSAEFILMLQKLNLPENKKYWDDEVKSGEADPFLRELSSIVREETVSRMESELKRMDEMLNALQNDYKTIFRRVHEELPVQIHGVEVKIRAYRAEVESMLEKHPRLGVAFNDVLEKLAEV